MVKLVWILYLPPAGTVKCSKALERAPWLETSYLWTTLPGKWWHWLCTPVVFTDGVHRWRVWHHVGHLIQTTWARHN